MDSKMTGAFNLSIPSLENICLSCIAIRLWNHDGVCILISKCNFSEMEIDEDYSSLEDIVRQKTSKLGYIPHALVGKLKSRIISIGMEYIKWKEFQSKISSDDDFIKLSLNRICWTVHGTVNDIITAETLINSKKLDKLMQYRLACHYCLENYAFRLWDDLSPEDQSLFMFQKPPEDYSLIYRLETFFTYYTINTIEELNSLLLDHDDYYPNTVYETAVNLAIENGNKTSTKFYLEKLTSEDRTSLVPEFMDTLIAACFKSLSVSEFYCFKGFYIEIALILLNFDSEQFIVSCTEEFNIILIFFIEWPLRELFLEILKSIKNFNADDFYYITARFLAKNYMDCKDCVNMVLMMQFWLNFPQFHIITQDTAAYLTSFLLNEFKEGVTLILKSVSPQVRKEFIFSSWGHLVCECLIHRKKFSIIKLLVEEILEKDELYLFQESFKDISGNGNFLTERPTVDSVLGKVIFDDIGDRNENYSAIYSYIHRLIKADNSQIEDEGSPLFFRIFKDLGIL